MRMYSGICIGGPEHGRRYSYPSPVFKIHALLETTPKVSASYEPISIEPEQCLVHEYKHQTLNSDIGVWVFETLTITENTDK